MLIFPAASVLITAKGGDSLKENSLAWGMIAVIANHVDGVMYWMMVVGRSNVRNERLWMESR